MRLRLSFPRRKIDRDSRLTVERCAEPEISRLFGTVLKGFVDKILLLCMIFRLRSVNWVEMNLYWVESERGIEKILNFRISAWDFRKLCRNTLKI